MSAKKLIADISKLKNKKRAEISSWFFKTGKGQYGEGDKFLGLTVPQQRLIAKKYSQIPLAEVLKLLKSPFHEHRLTSLLILVNKYQKSDEKEKSKIFSFYLKSTKLVNNWDLVDLSAGKIVGEFLINKNKSTLYKLARSTNLWERRIAIVASYAFIKNNEFTNTLKISEILVGDTHDLIQKAVGWMLREVGKRDQNTEEEFLKKHYKTMPRTMLRYAIEKFDEDKRKFYLGKIS